MEVIHSVMPELFETAECEEVRNAIF